MFIFIEGRREKYPPPAPVPSSAYFGPFVIIISMFKNFPRKPRKTQNLRKYNQVWRQERNIMTVCGKSVNSSCLQRLNFTFENVKIWLFCCQRTKVPGPKRLTFLESISHCGPVQDSHRSKLHNLPEIFSHSNLKILDS